jgi:phosphate transport system permease protein
MATTSERPVALGNAWTRWFRHGDGLFTAIVALFSVLVVGLVFAVGVVTYLGSAEARAQFGAGFFTGIDWNPIETSIQAVTFGAWPAVRGTLLTSLIAVTLAAPVGIGIGIYLSELCPRAIRQPLSFMVELLAAIPSVIYGLWGVLVLLPFFTDVLANPIADSLGTVIPALAQPVGTGRGIIAAGMILALMILPTISAITRDVLAVVPNTQREVMLALGATRWEVIWGAVLPYSRAGIVGGIMLGLGRALGETMAAVMIVGNTARISDSWFQPATTAASQIASELTNATSPLHESALIYLALTLFAITLTLNLAARILVAQLSRGAASSRF